MSDNSNEIEPGYYEVLPGSVLYIRVLKTRRENAPAPAKVPNVLALLPESFQTKAFTEAWKDFCTHRRRSGQPLTAKAVTLIAHDFINWGGGVAMAIESIETCIKQGWTGLFKPRKSSSGEITVTRSRPMPIGKRNKIINELNRKKQMIYRTFPDGKLAQWAVLRLAAIDRQLAKL
jgi:hypothetical protein